MGERSTIHLPRVSIGRRGVLAGGAATATAAMLPRPVLAGIPATRRIAFEVLRNGKPIGTHIVTFGPPGPKLAVQVQVDIVVTWADLVLYRYGLRASETWQDGMLIAAEASTNDDGTRRTMRATRRDGRLAVEGTHGPDYDAPERSIVASHWNPAELEAPMIDIQDGGLLDFTIDARGRGIITARGKRVEADHFALTGPAALELWYDRQHIWSKLKSVSWEGSIIVYRQV